MGIFGFGKKETKKVIEKAPEPIKIEDPAKKAYEEKQKELLATKELANELRIQFEAHPGIIVADYMGLSIDEDANIRKFFRDNAIKYRVFVNEAAKAAVSGTAFSDAAKAFEGRVGTVFIDAEEQLQLIVNYLKENPMQFVVKYSMLNGVADVFPKDE